MWVWEFGGGGFGVDGDGYFSVIVYLLEWKRREVGSGRVMGKIIEEDSF